MSRFQNPPQTEPLLIRRSDQLVTIEGSLPFDISKRMIVSENDAGRIRHRFGRQSLIYVDTPHSNPHFRFPLLPLVELELNRLGAPVNTSPRILSRIVQMFVQGALPELLLNLSENPLSARRLPRTSFEFILSNHHALVEVSARSHVCALIGACTVHFRPARIAVVALDHRACWQLKTEIDRFSGSSRSFVAVRNIPDDFIDSRWSESNPQIVVGTPVSLANNNRFAGVWMFDLIFIVDERLLRREPILDYLISARPGTHIITCVTKSIACDPRWQAELYEYSGFARGILSAGVQILGPPRIEYANLNWNVGGSLELTNDLEFVAALDTENRRMRAINHLLGRRRFNQDDRNVVVVFAMRRSVDAFLRLGGRGQRFSALGSQAEITGRNNWVALTTDQLSGIDRLDGAIVVWAGSRSSSDDLYRTLAPRLSEGASLRIVDIQDFPQSPNPAHDGFRQTVAEWNQLRRREYEQLGYLPAGGDAIQHTMDRARRLLIRNVQGDVQNV